MTKRHFSPETCRAVIGRIAAGVSVADAARAVDLSPRTVENWISRGRREGSGIYADFATAVNKARQEAKARPEPMTRDELLSVVSHAARNGSVPAMRLYHEMTEPKAEPAEAAPPANPLEQFDELAPRRAA